MRLIKPGKVALSTTEREIAPKKPGAAQGIQIWDDYAQPAKKTTKKKEYERAGDRMTPSKRPPRRSGPELSFSLAATEKEAAAAAGEEAPAQVVRDEVDYNPLETTLGVSFQDRALLECALTHRSALWARERTDYERLEFLGDAVLDLGIADMLSERYTEAKEGDLSKMRAALVNTEALAVIAKSLNIGQYIRLGRGELVSGGNERPSILADVMEAIIGAIYRDRGYAVAKEFVERIFGSAVEQVTPSDPKTELQEILHVTGSEPPEYLLELVEGPDHAPTFVVIVRVDGEIAGRGRAPTKKSAQRLAAAEALARIIPDHPPVQLAAGQAFIIQSALLTADNLGLAA